MDRTIIDDIAVKRNCQQQLSSTVVTQWNVNGCQINIKNILQWSNKRAIECEALRNYPNFQDTENCWDSLKIVESSKSF